MATRLTHGIQVMLSGEDLVQALHAAEAPPPPPPPPPLPLFLSAGRILLCDLTAAAAGCGQSFAWEECQMSSPVGHLMWPSRPRVMMVGAGMVSRHIFLM